MVKCPNCKKGDLLLFLQKTEECNYEVIYVCTICGQEITKEDLPFSNL
jgi:superfamily II helicase